MARTVDAGLYADIKAYLDITWVQTDVERAKLNGIIARGMTYLDGVAGCELDFDGEGKPRELLMDYCMYVRSNMLSDYQRNYLSELLSLQIQEG